MAEQTKYITKLKDSKVLVIGGSSGIGYGVAEAAIEHGAAVIISSSNKSRVDAAITTLKTSYPSASARISGYACDLADKDKSEENIKDLFAQTGKVDHIVLTASNALPIVPLDALTMDTIQNAGQMRFYVPLLLGKHAVNNMNPGPKSSITFTGGVLADRPIPNWALVTGFTAGLNGIVKALAIELKPIRINIVHPGMVDTPLYGSSGIPDDVKQYLFEDAKKRLPVQHVGRVEDLTEAYLYLMKDENVTGESVNSSGGALII